MERAERHRVGGVPAPSPAVLEQLQQSAIEQDQPQGLVTLRIERFREQRLRLAG
jgi:hypothetical protein